MPRELPDGFVRYYRAICCTCDRLGPARQTLGLAQVAAIERGWERCCGLWRCCGCVEAGMLPDYAVSLAEVTPEGVRIAE